MGRTRSLLQTLATICRGAWKDPVKSLMINKWVESRGACSNHTYLVRLALYVDFLALSNFGDNDGIHAGKTV